MHWMCLAILHTFTVSLWVDLFLARALPISLRPIKLKMEQPIINTVINDLFNSTQSSNQAKNNTFPSGAASTSLPTHMYRSTSWVNGDGISLAKDQTLLI